MKDSYSKPANVEKPASMPKASTANGNRLKMQKKAIDHNPVGRTVPMGGYGSCDRDGK